MVRQNRLPLSLLLYIICFAALFPWYRHVFDSDNMGYYMVTTNLAAGDFFKSINGYWSPLHSWLALPLYKAGLNIFDSFRLVSGLAGAGTLIMVNRLLRKFVIHSSHHTAALFVCVPVVLCYVYYNQAADILLCACLLLYTDIITEKDFFGNRKKIIACGLAGCTSYFAKTYALPFFLVHFTITQLVLYRHSIAANRKKLLFRNLFTGITCFLLPALPWILALYHKYHFVTYGYSGKLNFEWTMYNTWGYQGGKLYAFSPGDLSFHWQDPWSYPWNFQQHLPYFSAQVIIKQIGTVIRNLKQLLQAFNFISFTTSAIIPVLGIYAFKKKAVPLQLVFLVMLILPAGYLLLAVEERYLWPVGLLALITGTALLAAALRQAAVAKPIRRLCWCIFFGSFLLFPLYHLKFRFGTEKDVFDIAAALKAKGVQGKFLNNGFEYLVVPRKLAYLTGSTLYQLSRDINNYEELLAASRESGIDYIIYMNQSSLEKSTFKNSILYKSAVSKFEFPESGITVLKMH